VKVIWNSSEDAPRGARGQAAQRSRVEPSQPWECAWFGKVMDAAAQRVRTLLEQGDMDAAMQQVRAAREMRKAMTDAATGAEMRCGGDWDAKRAMRSRVVRSVDAMSVELVRYWRGDPYMPR
jgi:hypothetical protein